MPVIVVANPKGGVGKSTLSTNIAGYLAAQGRAVMLGDVDRQQSSRIWLGLRPESAPQIQTWDVTHDNIFRPPKGTSYVVLDTPAGLHGKRLDEVMKLADKIVVPLQPSIFDIHATHDFIKQIQSHKSAHKHSHKVQIGLVGMRMKEGTISADQLRSFLAQLDVPVLGWLRDTQNYIHLAARGLTLWDVAPSRVERDLDQWQPVVAWLNS
jgi:chromosome partitioning protein